MVALSTRPAGTGRLFRWAVLHKILACVVAVAFIVLGTPSAVAWGVSAPVEGSTDGGPGIWRTARVGGATTGGVSWNYEQQIKGGNEKAIGAIVGAVMRETKGRADGGEVQRMIRERI